MSTSHVRSVLANSTKFTVLAASSALLFSSLTAPAAAALDDSTPAGAAASYLLRDAAANGGHFMAEWNGQKSTDIGLNIDAAFGLAAGGSTKQEAQSVVDYTTSNIAEYSAGSAGAKGKALAYATLVGEDPRAIDGADLIQGLEELRQEDGSYKRGATSTDTLDSLNQAWVVLGLFRAGQLDGGVTNPAVTYLASLQCEDGSFRDWSNACTGDPDTTGFAVEVLAAVGEIAAAAKGAQFIAGLQNDKGGVKNQWGPENANSTAIAANAFTSVKDQANAVEAVAFLKSLQLGSSKPAAVRGGVANTEADVARTVASDDSLRRSTAQAVVALAGQTYATVKFSDTSSQPSNPSTPSTPADSLGGAAGSSTGGIIALVLAVLGALTAGFFALNPQLLPRF